MEEYIQVISTVGFPIFITLWFMFRMEHVINANTEATDRMNLTLEKYFFKEK